MIPYINIHSHRKTDFPDEIAIINCDYDTEPQPTCSIGVHPWNSMNVYSDPDFIDKSVRQVLIKSVLPDVVAIGEAGLDKLRGADIGIQLDLFIKQIEISESTGKPLIIHCVKYIDEIIKLRNKIHPKQKWIIHGYRNKSEQAKLCISHGIDLSFGKHYDEKSLRIAYESHSLWLETDESDIYIGQHYQNVADVLSIDVESLKLNIYNRACLISSVFHLE